MKSMLKLLAVLLTLAMATSSFAQTTRRSVSASDFGAKGDGTADDTAAIQNALDAVGGGGVTHLPAGAYRLSAMLRIPHGATLIGEGARWENSATRLVVPEPGFSAVRLDHGCSIKGLAISYPNNADTINPKEYPPAILMMGINPSVENIVFDCAWTGCFAPADANVGQGLFRDITGFVHRCGIRIERGADVNRFEDIHWFVGGVMPPGKEPYFRKNRVGFEFNSVDGVVMSGCFIIGGKTFLHQGIGGGHSLGFQISRCWIEDVDAGFVFEGACGFVIDNSNILVRDQGVGVRILTDGLFYNAAVTSTQIRGFGKPFVGIDYEVRKSHERNRLSVADCSIVDCAPAIRLGPGAARANIHDNHLRPLKGSPAIAIDKTASLFTITNNIIAADAPAIDDKSGDVPKTVSGNLLEPRAKSQAFAE